MTWTTATFIDLRSTAAYVTDPSGAGVLAGAAGGPTGLPAYNPGTSGSNSPITINGNTFNCGWNVPGNSNDGARNENSSVTDKRLAGCQENFADGTNNFVFSIQAGTAPGKYNIWLGITNQSGYGFPAGTITISDANGTLGTVTTPAGHSSGTAVCDATGTSYANAAAWTAAAGGAGNSIQVTSTDTSNGNGGPLIKLTFSAVNFPLACVGIQFAGSGGGSAPPQPSPFAVGVAEFLPLAPLSWVIRRRLARSKERK